mgnify:CR=1 FL=1
MGKAQHAHQTQGLNNIVMGTLSLYPSYNPLIIYIGQNMNYRRLYLPGAHYFFTVVTENRTPLLIENIERLREAFPVLCSNRTKQEN